MQLPQLVCLISSFADSTPLNLFTRPLLSFHDSPLYLREPQNQANVSVVLFLGCPWSYRGHGHDRIRQLRLVQPSGPPLDDSQTVPQLERPLRRPDPRHQSFDPYSILAHLSHSHHATVDMAPLRCPCALCALGRFCFHLHL